MMHARKCVEAYRSAAWESHVRSVAPLKRVAATLVPGIKQFPPNANTNAGIVNFCLVSCGCGRGAWAALPFDCPPRCSHCIDFALAQGDIPCVAGICFEGNIPADDLIVDTLTLPPALSAGLSAPNHTCRVFFSIFDVFYR